MLYYQKDPHELYTVYDYLDAIKESISCEGIDFQILHSFYPIIKEENFREIINNDKHFRICGTKVYTV